MLADSFHPPLIQLQNGGKLNVRGKFHPVLLCVCGERWHMRKRGRQGARAYPRKALEMHTQHCRHVRNELTLRGRGVQLARATKPPAAASERSTNGRIEQRDAARRVA